MTNINRQYFDLGAMDRLASGDSLLHRLDPRIKLITTVLFIATVVSFDKYAVIRLFPFFLYPAVLISLGRLPIGFILKKVCWALPFAIFVGIFNPFIDTRVLAHLGPLNLSGGSVSFVSIIIRCLLTVSAALSLVAVTGFNAIVLAMQRIGVPRVFVVQLLFLYRYLFVLAAETERLIQGWSFKSFGRIHIPVKTFISLIGHLLVRAMDRSERIYLAMLSRGFDGEVRVYTPIKVDIYGFTFLAGWCLLFFIFRYYNVPVLLEQQLWRYW